MSTVVQTRGNKGMRLTPDIKGEGHRKNARRQMPDGEYQKANPRRQTLRGECYRGNARGYNAIGQPPGVNTREKMSKSYS